MGFLPTKIYCLLFLIIFVSLVSSSYAGRQSKFTICKEISAEEMLLDVNKEASIKKKDENNEESMNEIRRLLRANTHDYARYDPTPSLPRPRHKLIPN